MAQIHHTAAHARADPPAGVAEDDGLATGHVLEREATKVAAEDDLGARQADRRARVGSALNEEAPALRAVGEALADGSVDEPTIRVARFQDRGHAAERGLGRPILRPAAER